MGNYALESQAESNLIRLAKNQAAISNALSERVASDAGIIAETGKASRTELYVDTATGGLMVTCSIPVYSPGGNLTGVVAADVTLKTVTERIINTQAGESGYAFLPDGNSNIVAGPGLCPTTSSGRRRR